jgi:hypothetical protein
LRHSFPPIDSIRSSPRSRNRTMSPSRNNFEIWLYIGVGSFLILFLVVLVLMN